MATTNNYSITLFDIPGTPNTGRRVVYEFPYEVERDMRVLDELTEEIAKPQAITPYGYHPVEFIIQANDHNFIGTDSLSWAMRIRGVTGELYSFLIANSTVGADGLYTFKADFQTLLREKYREYADKLSAIHTQMTADAAEQQASLEARRAGWTRTKVYKLVTPSGGETGRDGYVDAEYTSANGAVVRMIERDVFDVGHYSYPERLDDPFDHSQWTADEVSAAKWIAEFGEFHGYRM